MENICDYLRGNKLSWRNLGIVTRPSSPPAGGMKHPRCIRSHRINRTSCLGMRQSLSRLVLAAMAGRGRATDHLTAGSEYRMAALPAIEVLHGHPHFSFVHNGCSRDPGRTQL